MDTLRLSKSQLESHMLRAGITELMRMCEEANGTPAELFSRHIHVACTEILNQVNEAVRGKRN